MFGGTEKRICPVLTKGAYNSSGARGSSFGGAWEKVAVSATQRREGGRGYTPPESNGREPKSHTMENPWHAGTQEAKKWAVRGERVKEIPSWWEGGELSPIGRVVMLVNGMSGVPFLVKANTEFKRRILEKDIIYNPPTNSPRFKGPAELPLVSSSGGKAHRLIGGKAFLDRKNKKVLSWGGNK